jgi:hypothetical protein
LAKLSGFIDPLQWKLFSFLLQLSLFYFVYFISMKKFQVTIQFEMSDDFMELIPPHRTYINYLINKDIIEQYAVSMETQRVWITLTAKSKPEVEEYLKKSPLYKFWTLEIDELFVIDGHHYRLPAVQPN